MLARLFLFLPTLMMSKAKCCSLLYTVQREAEELVSVSQPASQPASELEVLVASSAKLKATIQYKPQAAMHVARSLLTSYGPLVTVRNVFVCQPFSLFVLQNICILDHLYMLHCTTRLSCIAKKVILELKGGRENSCTLAFFDPLHRLMSSIPAGVDPLWYLCAERECFARTSLESHLSSAARYAMSKLRRRKRDETVAICSDLLSANGRDQAAWYVKTRAMTLQQCVDDTEMEEERVGDALLDENAIAGNPRPGTSINRAEVGGAGLSQGIRPVTRWGMSSTVWAYTRQCCMTSHRAAVPFPTAVLVAHSLVF
jgi:hypothetical protein